MENSQLIIILRSLDKKELRDLRKWLQSPIHNTRTDTLALFDYLTAADHLTETRFLQKEWLARKIFPKESYDDGKFRQTVHFLLKSVEDFLIYQERAADELSNRLVLTSVYRKRKLEKSFLRSLRQAKQLQSDSVYRNETYFRNEYLLQLEEYYTMEGKQRTTQMNLQEVIDSLDMTYLLEKLRQSCRMVFHQTVYKAADYKFNMVEEILRHIEQRELTQHSAIAVYYYVFQAITHQEDISWFEKLREQIQRSEPVFSHEDIREIYLMAINYCIGKMNAGIKPFIREAFELYRQGLESSILIQDNVLSRWTYLNVVLIALILGEFEWTSRFIPNYSIYIEPRYRENFVQYCQARLYFEQKNYKAAMQLLVQSDFNDILINLYAKAMLLKMLYEQDEIDTLESLLESMRAYLLRKDIMGYHKSNYQNFIRYMRKMIRLTPYDTSRRDALREEIKAANPLTERQWLLEQLERI